MAVFLGEIRKRKVTDNDSLYLSWWQIHNFTALLGSLWGKPCIMYLNNTDKF